MQKKKATATTFCFNELIIEVHPEVYDPAEDSFLLLETIQVDSNKKVLELGTGCGLIALECARQGAQVLCSDVNPFAVQLTRHNIERNHQQLKGSIEVRQGDLFSIVHEKELFDVIVFNPPYLPTLKKERVGGWFDVATDGGRDGLTVTKRFIRDLKKHLFATGYAYFIFSSLSSRSTLERYLKQIGFTYEVAARRLFEGEELDVYKVAPTD
jgi:release factor glutamine methyltransferase